MAAGGVDVWLAGNPARASAGAPAPHAATSAEAQDEPAGNAPPNSTNTAVSGPDSPDGRLQVQIEAKFVEAPPELAGTLGLLNEGEMDPADAIRVEGILDEAQFRDVIRRLDESRGVDLMSSPKVTTRPGRNAVIEIVREFRYPTEFESSKDAASGATPTKFETKNVGVTLEVTPGISAAGRIDLILSPRVVEFLGFINYAADRSGRGSLEGDALEEALTPSPSATHAINQPVFSTRRLTTSATLRSGQTALIGGLGSGEVEGSEKQVFIFVTARTLGADYSAPAEQAPTAPAMITPRPPENGMPYGVPVPNKPGFVTSPHAPRAGYVDLRGFPADTEVKCPYSGRMFLVP